MGTGLRPWAFFELAGDPSAAAGKAPLLFVPPSLASSLEGAAVERVTFVRDEAANVAWGIEETIESPSGRPLRRRLQSALTAPADVEPSEAWQWRLQTAVPPYWIPFLPERIAAGSAQIRLRRGRMLAWEELEPSLAGPQGRILAPRSPLRLREESIPASGVTVTRAFEAARGSDGRLVVWLARETRPGRGERGSGLKFDPIVR